MLSIVMSLSVKWPEAVETLLAVVSSLTSVGSHTSTVMCTSTNIELSHAEVYYGMLVLSATLPFAVMALTFVYWHFCAPVSKLLSCGLSLIRKTICPNENPFKNARNSNDSRGSHLSLDAKGKVQRSTRDGWIVTNVLILYIFIPSIVKAGLQMFQSEKICGVDYWALDDTVKYYDPVHQIFIYTVAVPALFLYGFVFIVLALLYIGLHQDRQTNKKLIFRFGLLFSGYAPQNWWYEIILFFRKLGLIFIVTFTSSNAQQLHITTGLLVTLLYLQEHMRPFDNPEASKTVKIKNNRLHRMESFSLLILITMVWCAVFFVLGCDDRGRFCSVLGVSVILINVVFVGFVGVIFAQAWSKKNNLSQKFSSLTNRFRSSENVLNALRNTRDPPTRQSTVHVVNDSYLDIYPTLFTTGESKIKCNPLANGKSKIEFSKERRRNSVRNGKKNRSSSSSDGIGIGESKQVEMTAITEVVASNEIGIQVNDRDSDSNKNVDKNEETSVEIG